MFILISVYKINILISVYRLVDELDLSNEVKYTVGCFIYEINQALGYWYFDN